MIIIIILTILVLLLILGAFRIDDREFGYLLCMAGTLIFGTSLLVVLMCYICSGKESEYIKKRYGLEYSQEEMFWNGVLVKSELKSKGIYLDSNQRMEINLK